MGENIKDWITFDERQTKGIHILALACPWCYEQVEIASVVGRLQRVCPRCVRIFHIVITVTRHYPRRRMAIPDNDTLLGLAEVHSTRQLAPTLGVSHNTVARWIRNARKAAAQNAEPGVLEIAQSADPADGSDLAASAALEPDGSADEAHEDPDAEDGSGSDGGFEYRLLSYSYERNEP